MLEDYRDCQSNEFKIAERFITSKLMVPARSGALRLVGLVIAASVMLNLTGCNIRNLAVRDAILVSYRDAVWAKRAFNLRYGNCERPYSDHFESGFCAGYSDTCNGGDGYVPAMPPPDYRGFEYQSGEGVQCVNAWFEGYPAGVAAARKENMGNYNNVLTSKMINSAIAQERATNILPSDIPVVNKVNQVNNAPQQQSSETSPVSMDGQLNKNQSSHMPINSDSSRKSYSSTSPNELQDSHRPASYTRRPRTSVIGSGVEARSIDGELPEEDFRIEVPSQDSKPIIAPPSSPTKNPILTPVASTPK